MLAPLHEGWQSLVSARWAKHAQRPVATLSQANVNYAKAYFRKVRRAAARCQPHTHRSRLLRISHGRQCGTGGAASATTSARFVRCCECAQTSASQARALLALRRVDESVKAAEEGIDVVEPALQATLNR